MAKHIFPLIFSPCTFLGFMLLTSSCSKDDVSVNVNGGGGSRIEIRTSLPEITSRAAEVDKETLNKIMVSSFIIGESSVSPYFLYKGFSRNDSTKKFVSYDPECIWPNNNDLLRFVAFYPSREDMREATGYGEDSFKLTELTAADVMETYSYSLSGFKVADDIASHFDFVTAIGSGKLLDDEENGVNLNFHHQLSRIELKAWGASKSYSLEIAGVRLGGVGVGGEFSFMPQADATDASGAGSWTSVSKGSVEYIFGEGDKIVLLDKDSGSHSTDQDPAYLLRARIAGEDSAEGNDNSAMLIPSDNESWKYAENPDNKDADGNPEGMYFSVLVRVTDTTPYAPDSIVYPYADNADGMEVVYFAVDDENTVKARLYRLGDEYFTDADHKQKYDLEADGAEPKAFGWAALPVAGNWKPGYVYTYTLNYTYGVGLRAPEDPKSGTPIISDKVLINVDVKQWLRADEEDVTVPRR